MTPDHPLRHQGPPFARLLPRIAATTVLSLVPWGLANAPLAAPLMLVEGGIGEDGAARAAAAAAGGKVLSVRWSEAGGRPVYEVTVLRGDGQVVVVRVDAQSGAVVGA